MAGLLCSAALGLAAMLLSDSMKGSRLLAWLRADAVGHAPPEVGVWGEIAYQIEKVLRRRELATLQEQQRLTQFLDAVDASPIGVLLLDSDDRMSWCSRIAADHLGLDPKRDLAQPITNLVRAPAFVERLDRRMNFDLAISDRTIYLTLGDETLTGTVDERRIVA